MVNHSGTEDLPDPAHKLKDKIAHKESPASRGPDSREHSTANPSSSSNPSGKTEGAFSKGHHPPRHTSDHPPTTPPRSTSCAKLEGLDSRLTPLQRRQLKTLKGKEKDTDTPSTTSSKPTASEVQTLKGKEKDTDTPSTTSSKPTASEVPPRPKSSTESKDLPPDTSQKYQEGVAFLPPSPGSPASPDPTTPRSPSPDRTSSPIPTIGTVKDLVDALTEKLKDIGRHSTIPLPQFRGKKGEDPNDHCMKVKDYFAIFSIESVEDQKKRFLETLFEKAR